MAKLFLINNQKPNGNFVYEFNAVNGISTDTDMSTRQAGALWGLTLLNQYEPSRSTENAIKRGIAFFFKNSIRNRQGGALAIHYPGESQITTGTVALVGLALIEFLRSNPSLNHQSRVEFETILDQYLEFLVFMQKDDGHFASTYDPQNGARGNRVSPYYDGEALLCLAKAAKYLDRTNLIPHIKVSTNAFIQFYCASIHKPNPDTKLMNGFYQWGSMAFWEIQSCGWQDINQLRNAIIYMAHWLIEVEEVSQRVSNQAYAVEGLAHAYQVAICTKNKAAAQAIFNTCTVLTDKIIKSQVMANSLSLNKDNLTGDHSGTSFGVGGFQTQPNSNILRIDTTQHSIHALILMLKVIRSPPYYNNARFYPSADQ